MNCNICNKTFKNNAGLSSHLRSCEKLNKKCQYCNKLEKRYFFRKNITCKECQLKQNKIRQQRWELKQKGRNILTKKKLTRIKLNE
jgi:hypothetical protein